MSTMYAGQSHRPRKQKFWQKKWFPMAAVGTGALLLGVIVGAGGQPEPVEVVREVPGPERVVTKTVEKEVTPKACLEALDLSQQGFTYSSEAMGYMSTALTAAGNFDVATLEQTKLDLEKLTPKMGALTMPMQKANSDCRAGAE